MDGTPLELEISPMINTKQRCTSPKCPLRRVPHQVGQFSYGDGCFDPHVISMWVSRNDVDPNSGIPEFGSDPDFWAGNLRIPTTVQKWTAVALEEERIWKSGDVSAIKEFHRKYPQETVDAWRLSIKEFRRFHCFYERVPGSRHLQRDTLSENLRLGRPGRELWNNNFIAELPKVPITDLAEDDRECFVCKGVYEQDEAMTGQAEKAAKLNCSHVIGTECLSLLILKKTKDSGGFGHDSCPVCRRKIWKTPEVEVTEQPTGFTFVGPREQSDD